MSTAGAYLLINNDGKQEQILFSAKLLSDRLQYYSDQRCKRPEIRDKTPSLFEIEQTHMIYVHSHFRPFVAVASEYNKMGATGAIGFGNTLKFSIPQVGDFYNDMAIRFQFSALTLGPTATKARFCDFLGHRLMKRVQYEVNNTIIDEYDSDWMMMNYAHHIRPERRATYNSMIGQQIAKPAYFQQDPADEYSEVKMIVNGLQTYKVQHNAFEIYVPLQFWFNKAPEYSILNISSAFGSRYINVVTATLDEIILATPLQDINFKMISAELYVDCIYVNPEILDIMIKKIGFSLVRLYRYQRFSVTGPDQFKIDQFKWPIETIYFGLRPTANVGTMDDWWRFHVPNKTNIYYPSALRNPASPPTYMLGFSLANFTDMVPTIDTLKFETKGINIFDQQTNKFYNEYLPTSRGPANGPSDDIGLGMIRFNMKPGDFNPSGHLNFSTTKDFIATLATSQVTPIAPAEFLFIGIALNFIIIGENKFIQRYT